MSEEINVIKYLEQLKEHSSDKTLKDFVSLSLELLYSFVDSDIFNDLGFASVAITEKYLQTKDKEALKGLVRGLRWILK